MQELTNKEQLELLKKWWHDYGKGILLAVIVGLLLGYGWRFYKRYTFQKQVQAAQAYQMVLLTDSQGDQSKAKKIAGKLVKEYPGSIYATTTKLLLASYNVKDKQYAQAYADLQWVIDHSKVAGFRQIARLRAARVLLQMNKPKQALVLLKTVDDPAYAKVIAVLKSQASSHQG